jgi:carbon starvation protein
MVNAVFAVIIANLFMSNPGAVLPVWGSLAVALVVGFLIYRTGAGILVPSIAALLILYALIWFGQYVPFELPDLIGFGPTAAEIQGAGGDAELAAEAARADGQRVGWIAVLFVYTFFASVLPVWLLLQPRDYVNGHQLFVALALIGAGVFVTNPRVVAPAINLSLPADAPNWLPLLFITIACGAISGFHGLVGSGTSSKQLAKQTDARYVGYGGALGEGTLAVVSIIATTAGFALFVGIDGWHEHYGSWASASAGATTAFVNGVGVIAEGLGIPHAVATIFAAVIVISFAATSLDTSVRLQRYIIGELGVQYRVKVLQNRWLATLVAVGSSALRNADLAPVRDHESAAGGTHAPDRQPVPHEVEAPGLGHGRADELRARHDDLGDGPQPHKIPEREPDAPPRRRRCDLRAGAVAPVRGGGRRSATAGRAAR